MLETLTILPPTGQGQIYKKAYLIASVLFIFDIVFALMSFPGFETKEEAIKTWLLPIERTLSPVSHCPVGAISLLQY